MKTIFGIIFILYSMNLSPGNGFWNNHSREIAKIPILLESETYLEIVGNYA